MLEDLPPQRAFIFDTVGFLKNFLLLEGIDAVVSTQGRTKGRLAIKYFNRDFPQDDPALVEFAKNKRDHYVTLRVDKKVWDRAVNGESFPNEILAHEAGHILLHDHYANAFSTDARRQVLFAGTTKEDFAEWQAITFASHLLIPTHVAKKFPTADVLAAATNTTETFARSRLAAIEGYPEVFREQYEKDVCVKCGNVTLLRSGCATTCCTCGDIIQD